MNPIPLLCITHYNRPDLTERCIRSIDYPVERFVIQDNSPESEIMTKDAVCDWVWPDGNFTRKICMSVFPGLGCGPTANLMMKRYPLPWWAFSGNDIEFRPGDLKKMADACWQEHEKCAGVVSNVEAAFMAITWRGMNKVGLLDENFYPCYMEDFDWFYRCKIAGEKLVKAEGVNVLHGYRGECSATIESDGALKLANNRSYAVNVAYYESKWGGYWQHETFTTPYNIPNAPPSYWKFMPELRKVQIWEKD